MPSYSTGLLQAITEDHIEIYAYYDQFVTNRGNINAQERWFNQLAWELARHSIGEELVVHPLFEKYLGAEGAALANKDRLEHQAVKERLYELDKLKVGSEEHASLLKDMIEQLRNHTAEEEQQDLPSLEGAIGIEESIRAATRFSQAKYFVPTRTHPSATDKPPYETLAALLSAPIDKLKAVFSRFPSEEDRRASVETKKQN